MADTRETVMLLDEEKATLKRLKTGWAYISVPFIFMVAWVFGEALFGTEPAIAFRRLVDTVFISCSMWVMVFAIFLHRNGILIDRAADGNKENFRTVNRLVNTRRNLFSMLATMPIAMYVTFYIQPLLSFSDISLSGKNSLAIIWFVGIGTGGFKECGKIIPALEKAGKI